MLWWGQASHTQGCQCWGRLHTRRAASVFHQQVQTCGAASIRFWGYGIGLFARHACMRGASCSPLSHSLSFSLALSHPLSVSVVVGAGLHTRRAASVFANLMGLRPTGHSFLCRFCPFGRVGRHACTQLDASPAVCLSLSEAVGAHANTCRTGVPVDNSRCLDSRHQARKGAGLSRARRCQGMLLTSSWDKRCLMWGVFGCVDTCERPQLGPAHADWLMNPEPCVCFCV